MAGEVVDTVEINGRKLSLHQWDEHSFSVRMMLADGRTAEVHQLTYGRARLSVLRRPSDTRYELSF